MSLSLIKQIIKEELDIFNKKKAVSFEDNPLEFLINKYPSLDATMGDLLTSDYRDFITGIFVVAPKPTTFRILLHNGQEFYLIYGPKSYIAKVSGKKYNLMNLVEEQFAIKSIAALLELGMPAGSEGPTAENTNVAEVNNEEPAPFEEPSAETQPAEETPEEENLEESSKPNKITFRII